MTSASRNPDPILRALKAIALPMASFGVLFLLAFGAERAMRPDNSIAIERLTQVVPDRDNTLRKDGSRYRSDAPFERTARFAFDLPGRATSPANEAGPQAILMISARRNVEVELCGETLQGRPGEWRAERFKYFAPQFFTLQPLQCADDRVFIDLDGGQDTVRLRTVFVGPEKDIQSAYRMRRFLAIDLTMVATGVAATASILALAAAALGQSRVLFLSFSAMMAAWSLRNLYYTGPLSEWRIENSELWFYVTTYGLLVVSAVFVNRWTIKSRFVDRWMIAPIAVLFVVATLGVANQGFVTIQFVDMAGWIVGLIAISLMFGLSTLGVYRQVGAPWFESFLFLTAGAGAVLDLVGTMAPGFTRSLIGGEGLTIPYATTSAIVATWAIVVFVGRQNAAVQKRLEGSNALLMEKLAEREAALDAVYQEREKEAREATLLRERQRIMQDIHDGFGGRLLALLLQAEDEKLDRTTLRDKLRDGLQDLRLIVDSMDTADGDMGLAFGALRGRLEPDLTAAGIELVWSVDIEETDSVLGSRETLSIYRIIQEAVANTIRHSGATRMEIAIALEGDKRLKVRLSDNGSGRGETLGEPAGQGLRNMRNRVRDLGGKLVVTNRDPGFKIEFEVSLRQSEETAIEELQ
ncbi:MAG: ATP-binding protein [Pseudomonadota bacterium]